VAAITNPTKATVFNRIALNVIGVPDGVLAFVVPRVHRHHRLLVPDSRHVVPSARFHFADGLDEFSLGAADLEPNSRVALFPFAQSV
jgi:hypothetical protein